MSEFLIVYSATLRAVLGMVPTFLGIFLGLMTIIVAGALVFGFVAGVFNLVCWALRR